jgi:hypothetical protein
LSAATIKPVTNQVFTAIHLIIIWNSFSTSNKLNPNIILILRLNVIHIWLKNN